MEKTTIEKLHTYQVQELSGGLNIVRYFQANPKDVENTELEIELSPNVSVKRKRKFIYTCQIIGITAIVISLFFSLLYLKTTREYAKENIEWKKTTIELQETLNEMDQEATIIQLMGECAIASHTKPSDTAIYNLAVRAGAYYPEIVVAQAIQESGVGISALGKNANNLYGMTKVPTTGRHRATTQIPNQERNGFGVYQNWQMATIDRILWDFAAIKHKPRTRKEYIAQMCNVYCNGNTEYPDKIEQVASNWLKKHK